LAFANYFAVEARTARQQALQFDFVPMLLMEDVVMRMNHLAPLLRSTIGFDRPPRLQSQRRRGLRWIDASHRRRPDDDDDPPPTPAAMRLALPQTAQAQGEPGPAMLWAA
jgi:hypothetical protein